MSGKAYNAENSDGKLKSHSLLIDFIQDHLNAVTGAILSGTSLKFEEKIIKRTQWPELHLVEIDKRIYKQLVTNIKKKNFENCTIVPHNADIKDVILATRNTRVNGYFNFAWLDFCSFFTPEMWTSVQAILNSKNLADKTIFAITMSGRRDGHEGHCCFYRKLLATALNKSYNYTKHQPNGVNLKKFRNEDIPALLKLAIENAGFIIREMPQHFSYNTPCPMKMYYFYIERV